MQNLTDTPNSTHHTIGTWLLAIVRTLDARGYDGKKVLTKAGIDHACLTDANSRVELHKMNTLWNLAVAETGDDCFGLGVGRHVVPTTFHALTFALQASSTLREILERTVRFSEIISTAAKLEVVEEAAETKVYLTHPDLQGPQPTHQAVDAFASLAAFSLDRLLQSRVRVLKAIHLRRPPPQSPEQFHKHFRCNITFNATENEFVFSNEFMDSPIPSANPEIAFMNEQLLANYLSKLKKEDIVAAVLKKIAEIMPSAEPSQERVAAELGMSTRSLHRKLKEKGVNYKTILDDARKHLAFQLIRQPDLSITQISYQLGFFDSSSFSRSFKRWSGVSPSQCRKDQKS
jgi:AraC-like DNA-binding protein